VREHHLHGIVTGLERVKVLSSFEDGLDRLVVSFKDAKVGDHSYARFLYLTPLQQIALLEWSESVHDLITVSIHTYERAPQLVSEGSCGQRQSTDVDNRCLPTLPTSEPVYVSTLFRAV
jgi:cleavage and polyadenylation specificity factor subunit 1